MGDGEEKSAWRAAFTGARRVLLSLQLSRTDGLAAQVPRCFYVGSHTASGLSPTIPVRNKRLTLGAVALRLALSPLQLHGGLR